MRLMSKIAMLNDNILTTHNCENYMPNKEYWSLEDHDIFRLGVKMVLIETGYTVDEVSEDEFLNLIRPINTS